MRRSLSTLKSRAGVARVCRMADFGAEAFTFEATEDADVIVLDELGLAIVSPDGDQAPALAAV